LVSLALSGYSISDESKATATYQPGAMTLPQLQSLNLSTTNSGNQLWKETVSGLSSQFNDPYLRAMFVFLTSPNVGVILENEGWFFFFPVLKWVNFIM